MCGQNLCFSEFHKISPSIMKNMLFAILLIMCNNKEVAFFYEKKTDQVIKKIMKKSLLTAVP